MTLSQRILRTIGRGAKALRASRRGNGNPRHRYAPIMQVLEERRALTTLMVTSIADSGAGTLRAAIANSINHTGGATGNDIIQFSPAIDGGTISLSTYVNDATVAGASAFRIDHDVNLEIDGQTGLTKGVTIARASASLFRLFYVYPGASLTLEGLTLSGGAVQGGNGGNSDGGGGGGGGSAGLGGAIFNQGTLEVLDSTLTGNVAVGGNGGNSSRVYSGGGGGGGGLNGAGGKGNSGDITAGTLSLYGGGGGPPNGGPSDYRATIFQSGNGSAGGFGGGGSGGLADVREGLPSAASGFTGGFGGGGGGGGEVFNPPSGSYFLPSYNGEGTTGAGGGLGGFGGGAGGSSGSMYFIHGSSGGYGGGSGGANKGNSGGGGGGGAGMGGAIFNEAGSVLITNSTFTGDAAIGGNGGTGVGNNGANGQGLGGGLFNHNGTITVTNSTFSLDTANSARAIANVGDSAGATTSSITAVAVIVNSILGQADASVYDFVGVGLGTGISNAFGGADLIRNQTGLSSGIVSTADPLLGPLQNNGGTSSTMALNLGSPAFDAGNSLFAPPTDQRGMSRLGNPDIGAYENQLAGTIVVNSASDVISASDNKLSLREAIGLANGTLSYNSLSTTEQGQITRTAGLLDTITFDAGLNGSTLKLSTVGDVSAGPSAFLVNDQVVIDGPSGNSGITLSAAGTTMRLFNVTSTGNLTLQNLTLSGGSAQGFNGGNETSSGAGGGSAGLGGAIFNQGSLTIFDSTLTGNLAQGGAGGSFQYSLSGAGGAGGGGLNAPGGSASANQGSGGGGPNPGYGGSFLYPNGRGGGFGGGGGGGYGHGVGSGAGNGGAGGFGAGGGGVGSFVGRSGGSGGFGGGGGGGILYPGGGGGYGGGGGGGGINGQGGGGGGGAGLGGAVFNEAGTVVITNSTFSGNAADGGASGVGRFGSQPGAAGEGLGGGLFNHNGTISVLNSTFSANTADQGGRGVFNLGDGTTATAIINDTIIGQSDTSVEDFTGKTVNAGTNTTAGIGDLIRTQSGFAGTIVSTADPNLGALANNGGATPTMALLPNSPAIGAGGSTTLATPAAAASYFEPTYPGLLPGVYDYRVSAFNNAGETLASTEVSAIVPKLIVGLGLVEVHWSSVSGPVAGYKVYGRTTGSEQLIATLGATTTVFVDNGTVTPSGALPTANTTALTTDQRGVSRIGNTDIGAYALVAQTQTITFGSLATRTYGNADFAISATATSGLPVTFTASGAASVQQVAGVWTVHITGAGSATITAHQAGNAHYASAPDVAQALTIAQANAVITVTPYKSGTTTYDGMPHTALGKATGIGSVNLSGDLTLSGTTHTNAGTYISDMWTFHDVSGNYRDASGSVDDSIAKANATITVTPYTGASTTYDGNSHTAAGTATGVGNANLGGGLTLSGTTHINAGTYSGDAWSFAGGTNYNNASGKVIDSIAKANATVTVTGYSGAYDGADHGATGSEAGVNGENAGTLSLGATFRDVPGGTAHWVFTGNGNYNDQSGDVAIVITDAAPQVVAFDVLYGNGKSYDLTTSTRLDLPWMITGVKVVFDESVFGTSASLVRSNGALAIAGFSGSGTNTLVWTFQSALATADVVAQLLATGANGIHDPAGTALDGNGGGDPYSRAFDVLYGDFNDDGVVTLADSVLIRNAIGSSNIFADLNGDGAVNLTDVNIARSRLNARLP
jgi:hypothetical protein